MYRKKSGKIEKSLGLVSSDVKNDPGFAALNYLLKEKSGKDIESDSNYQAMKMLFSGLRRKYSLSSLELLQRIDGRGVVVPYSIFIRELSIFQSIVKYLRENLNFRNKEISALLKRSQKSVWQAYNNSRSSHKAKFKVSEIDMSVPIYSLNLSLTVFEAVVVYLKEKSFLNYHQIALVLKRDERTIWTIYNRARNKIGKK